MSKPSKTSAIKCVQKDQDCNSAECIRVEECHHQTLRTHCYAIFKQATKAVKNQTIHFNITADYSAAEANKIEILYAGCWSGGDECKAPDFFDKKYTNKFSVTSFDIKISDSLLEPSIQKHCIGYSNSDLQTGNEWPKNGTFCCCSFDSCNSNIHLTKEQNPFKVFATEMMNRKMISANSSIINLERVNASLLTYGELIAILFTSLTFLFMISVFIGIYLICKKRKLFASEKNRQADFLSLNKIDDLKSDLSKSARQLPISYTILKNELKGLKEIEEERINLNDSEPLIKPRDLELIEKVATGQLSSVWTARDKNSNTPQYAIKVFSASQKLSWLNEKEIYSLLSTSNKNILKYYGSNVIELPNTSSNVISDIEYWIITEFQTHGSLHDYLKENFLSWTQIVHMIHSILDGLAYLQTDSFESGKKFAIAHRDLKSKNILVKQDGMACCIADFGLALRLDNENKLSSTEFKSKVGTNRYMSPELIEGAYTFTKETFLSKINRRFR